MLAGSSLGNRAILAEIRRKAARKAWAPWPSRFLSDEAMLQFWKALRPELENSADVETIEVAIKAADLVF